VLCDLPRLCCHNIATCRNCDSGKLSLTVAVMVCTQAIARMERFVLEGRKLNGPPAAREVNTILKRRELEHEYARAFTYLLLGHVTTVFCNVILLVSICL